MSLERRVLVYTSAAAFAVLTFMWFFTPRGSEEPSAGAADTASSGAAGGRAPEVAQAQRRAAAKSGVAGAVAALQGSAAGSSAEVECAACREKQCTNYEDQGIDMVSGCFKSVNGAQGADTTDPAFISDCTAAVRCATETHCAASAVGAAACYCGSRSIDECVEHGPGADAPCVEQWMRAARSRDNKEVATRFSDLKYPAGWANFMLECDRVQCRGKCVRGGDSS